MEPEDWEVNDGWEKEVCRPVIYYPMAPRHAKFLLELVGKIMANGYSFELIVEKLDVRR